MYNNLNKKKAKIITKYKKKLNASTLIVELTDCY